MEGRFYITFVGVVDDILIKCMMHSFSIDDFKQVIHLEETSEDVFCKYMYF